MVFKDFSIHFNKNQSFKNPVARSWHGMECRTELKNCFNYAAFNFIKKSFSYLLRGYKGTVKVVDITHGLSCLERISSSNAA